MFTETVTSTESIERRLWRIEERLGLLESIMDRLAANETAVNELLTFTRKATETLDAMAQGRLPAWVYNHQAVSDLYQAEGALRALRNVRDAVCLTDGDKAAYDAIIAHPDRQYLMTVADDG